MAGNKENMDIIDETFKGLTSPSEVYKMGRDDLSENRPGNVLVEEVKKHSAAKGFRKLSGGDELDDVITSQKHGKRVTLDELKSDAEIKDVKKLDQTDIDE